MTSKEEIIDFVKQYVRVVLVAEQNPLRMISGEITSQQAGDIMKQLQVVESQLFVHEVCEHVGAPDVLKEHWVAKNDSACGNCWVTSGSYYHTDQHEVCQQKISRFFRTRDNLREFGKKLLSENKD